MYIYTGYGIAYDRLSSYRPPALKIRAISSRGSGRGQQGRTIWSRYDRAVRARANECSAFRSRPTQHIQMIYYKIDAHTTINNNPDRIDFGT